MHSSPIPCCTATRYVSPVVPDGSSDGYKHKSSVLSCEAVSYVSSAYIPACLRQGGRPTLSNAHRAAECAESAGNIRDDLDEVITLNSVSVIVAEYIPFGSNQVPCVRHVAPAVLYKGSYLE
jgi:hypothetical protein